MRRSILVLGVLVAGIAAACGDSAASVTPSASVAPTHLPGTSVRITVNGRELRPGATGLLADAGTSIVVLAFPVAMERASVETWLPRGDVPSWNDDKTLSLSIAASETLAGFKVPESRSKDGVTVIDIFFVPLEHAPSVVVSTFTVAELLSGARPPKAADATRVSIGRGYVAIASPDGAKLLTFLYGGAAPDPHVVDIAALILRGPHTTMIVGAASGWSQTTLNSRSPNPTFRTLFNMSILILTVQAAGQVYLRLGGRPDAEPGALIMPLVGMALTYFIVNTVPIAIAIAP